MSGSVGLLLDALLPESDGMSTAMGSEAGPPWLYGGAHHAMDLEAGHAIAAKVAERALPGQRMSLQGRLRELASGPQTR